MNRRLTVVDENRRRDDWRLLRCLAEWVGIGEVAMSQGLNTESSFVRKLQAETSRRLSQFSDTRSRGRDGTRQNSNIGAVIGVRRFLRLVIEEARVTLGRAGRIVVRVPVFNVIYPVGARRPVDGRIAWLSHHGGQLEMKPVVEVEVRDLAINAAVTAAELGAALNITPSRIVR